MPELSPRARELASWLLAPVLATAAIGFQIALDVPQAEMVEREEEPAKHAKVRHDAKVAKVAERNKTGKKPRQSSRPRNARQLEQQRKRWAETPLEEEPIDQSFRRRHEGLMRSVVARARTEVLDGTPPPPMQIRPACHTIRCDLELCGSSELIGGIADLLPTVTVLDQPLWHELREADAVHEPPARKDQGKQVCRRWIVSFVRDGAKARDLRIGSEQP